MNSPDTVTVVPLWRAALPFLLLTLPVRSNSITVPTGASAAVAVVTETEWARAQREERASPRKPKVVTDSRSEKEASLEVWCLRAATS